MCSHLLFVGILLSLVAVAVIGYFAASREQAGLGTFEAYDYDFVGTVAKSVVAVAVFALNLYDDVGVE